MSWTSITFNIGQILTAEQMNQVMANFTGLCDGEAGASKFQAAAFSAGSLARMWDGAASHTHASARITAAAVGANSVNIENISPRDTFIHLLQAVTNGNSLDVDLPRYSFFPQLQATGGSPVYLMARNSSASANSNTPRISVFNASGSTRLVTARSRHLAESDI